MKIKVGYHFAPSISLNCLFDIILGSGNLSLKCSDLSFYLGEKTFGSNIMRNAAIIKRLGGAQAEAVYLYTYVLLSFKSSIF